MPSGPVAEVPGFETEPAALPFRREVVEGAHDAFISLDSQGRVAYWNRMAEDMFGFTREQVRGRELAELIVPPRYREAHRQALRAFVAGEQRRSLKRTLQLAALRADGSEFPIELALSAVRTENLLLMVGWIRDTSERAVLLGELEAQLRGGAPGLAEILDSLAEAVTIRDPHNHIIYANRAAVEHMGFNSLEELQSRSPQSILEDYLVQDEHGQPVTMSDIPSVRLLAGQPAEPLVIRTIDRSSGEVHWNRLKATLLRDEGGNAAATVMIIEDVTAEKTGELRDRFLSQATETLMSSLDYQETLGNVAWLAVPEIADWCAVDLLDELGRRQQVVVAHRDPSKLELAERLRRFDPDEPRPDQGLGRVIRTGVTELYMDIPDEALVEAAVSAEHLSLLREVGFRSVLLVPLRTHGRTVGVMTWVTAESLRRFDESDREFAEEVAARAAIAVENARLATARRTVAETLQRSLLPEEVPDISDWQVATMYRPASASDEVEVGGDFYDFFQTERGWIVLLGDVTGRGVEAATMTSLVRHGARFLAKREQTPSNILHRLNQALREQPTLSLCSALCLRLDGSSVAMSSGGHPAPLAVRADGRIRELAAAGPILGAWDENSWPETTVRIEEDEMLFVYTDGVVDTRGERDRFGSDRLRRILTENANCSPQKLLAELEAALERFQIQGLSDDKAAVALRRVEARVEPEAAGAGAPVPQQLRSV